MLVNIMRLLIKYIKYVKFLIGDFFKFLVFIKKIILDEIFFDSKSREPFRELVKAFLYYIKSKLSLIFTRILIQENTLLNKIIVCLVKYILTFFFILWILFESLFFRFYLVDTPLDTKMFQDRKEFRKSRFIPIIGFEALSFYNRPFWRTFNNIMVFLSNLEAVFWIIFYVYILDFFFVLKLIYNFVFKFFSFLFFIITFFFFKVNFLLNHLFFVLLIFFWRIFFFIKKIFVTLNYLFILPFVLFLNFFNFIFKFFYNLYFFFKILNLKTDFKSEVLNSNKKNFQVSNNFVFFFDKVFFFCVFLENFICYLNYKLILFDLYNYKYFVYKNFFSFFTIFLKRFSFILKFLFYFYLFCCYFILFIFLFIIFYSYFYLPFFV